eukprot:5476350-Amphidinium_carterae.1
MCCREGRLGNRHLQIGEPSQTNPAGSQTFTSCFLGVLLCLGIFAGACHAQRRCYRQSGRGEGGPGKERNACRGTARGTGSFPQPKSRQGHLRWNHFPVD